MASEKMKLSVGFLCHPRLFFVILVICSGGDSTKIRKNRAEENRKRERLPPVRRSAKTDTDQRQNSVIKEQAPQMNIVIRGPTSQPSRQESIRPPSRSPAGSRFKSPKAAETVVKKERSLLPNSVPPKGRERRTEKRLITGPARQIKNSFPYEREPHRRSLASYVPKRNPLSRTRHSLMTPQ